MSPIEVDITATGLPGAGSRAWAGAGGAAGLGGAV